MRLARAGIRRRPVGIIQSAPYVIPAWNLSPGAREGGAPVPGKGGGKCGSRSGRFPRPPALAAGSPLSAAAESVSGSSGTADAGAARRGSWQRRSDVDSPAEGGDVSRLRPAVDRIQNSRENQRIIV